MSALGLATGYFIHSMCSDVGKEDELSDADDHGVHSDRRQAMKRRSET